MAVTESTENYLETILMLLQKQVDVHAIDICTQLGFSRPTVSTAVKQLKSRGYITVSPENHIQLTESGYEIAAKIYERHRLIAEILMWLGVDEETAFQDSCRIEHDLSEKSFDCIKARYLKSKDKS